MNYYSYLLTSDNLNTRETLPIPNLYSRVLCCRDADYFTPVILDAQFNSTILHQNRLWRNWYKIIGNNPRGLSTWIPSNSFPILHVSGGICWDPTASCGLYHWVRVTDIWVIELGHHRIRWWLVVCSAPSHYVNQCWLTVNWTLGCRLRSSSQGAVL